jgi:hypothetical protein
MAWHTNQGERWPSPSARERADLEQRRPVEEPSSSGADRDPAPTATKSVALLERLKIERARKTQDGTKTLSERYPN